MLALLTLLGMMAPASNAVAATPGNASSAAINAFVGRIAAQYGLNLDASEYSMRPLNDAAGSYVIEPKGPPVSDKETLSGSDGTFSLSGSERSTPRPVTGRSSTNARALTEQTLITTQATSTGFVWQAPYCYARYSNTYGWFDHCTQWGYETYSNSPSTVYWAFKQYGTCKSAGSWAIESCTLGSSSTQSYLQWADWSPKSDFSTSCGSTVSLNVQLAFVNVGASYTGCDHYDITKGSSPADFSNAWQGYAYHSERSVAYLISISTPSWQNPSLNIHWGVGGVLVCC